LVHAMARRAINVPLAPVIGGLSRSVAETFQRRPRRYEARTVQLPKLTVRGCNLGCMIRRWRSQLQHHHAARSQTQTGVFIRMT
jgi:hypothetical protein